MVAAPDRKGHRTRYEERLLGTEIDKFLGKSGESSRAFARRIRRPASSVESWRIGRTLPEAMRDVRALARGLEFKVEDLERLVQADRVLSALQGVRMSRQTYADLSGRLKAAIEVQES